MQTDGTTLVVAAGELDLVSADRLREVLARLSPTQCMRLDMAAVTFLNSTAISVLVDYARTAIRCGGSLHVCNASDHVRYVLSSSGLTGLLDEQANA